MSSGSGISCKAVFGIGRSFGGNGGEEGGVWSSRASCTTSGGGRAFGEMIIPGACEGSCGRRDHIAHPPKNLEGVGWEADNLGEGGGEGEGEGSLADGSCSSVEVEGSGGGGEFIRGVGRASKCWGNAGGG